MKKSMEGMDRWVAKKKASLQAMAKQKAEETKKEEKEEQKKWEKVLEGKTVAKQWRIINLKQHIKLHRQQKTKEDEEDKRKILETEKKEKQSKNAFETW